MLNCWCITWPVGFKRLSWCLNKRKVRLHLSIWFPNLKIYNIATCSITAFRKPSDYEGDTPVLACALPHLKKAVNKVHSFKAAPTYTSALFFHLWTNFNESNQYINPLKTKRRLLYLKTQFVPRSKHFSSRL